MASGRCFSSMRMNILLRCTQCRDTSSIILGFSPRRAGWLDLGEREESPISISWPRGCRLEPYPPISVVIWMGSSSTVRGSRSTRSHYAQEFKAYLTNTCQTIKNPKKNHFLSSKVNNLSPFSLNTSPAKTS